ncbi:tandem-95 repeat protein, partial [Xanthobacter autotrophicus]|uniref:tandem-95 repeat protein n=1 Tax=Xanthobacter autotrophicus TaxID=280 RepID=UPI0037285612
AYQGDSTQPAAFIDANGSARSFTYDAAGLITQTTWADGTALAFAYDADGKLTQSTNRRGETTSYAYDEKGNVTGASHADAGPATYSYDAAGHLAKVSTADGDTTIAYDAAGHVTQIDYPNGRSLTYTYDAAGHRTSMTDQDGHATFYEYDAAGRLAAVSDGGANRVAYSYDASGNLLKEVNSNGTGTAYSYDAGGRLTDIVNHAADASVSSEFHYSYDAAGLRSGVVISNGTWTYGYDDAGQLVSADFVSARAGVADKSISYVYDAAGNRVSATEDGVTTTYTANALNQYTSAGDATFTYDADGNMVSKTDADGTWTYKYNTDNRLVRVTDAAGSVTEYEYDAFGNRSAVSVDGVRTEYLVDPFGYGDVVAEYSTGGALTAQFLNGYGLAARIGADGSGAFYDLDAVASVVGVSGADGTLANSYGYTPFGTELWETETIANSFEFNGGLGVSEDENGLIYMRARSYDAELGRFLSEDPLWLSGDVGNLYRFAENEPISNVDPTGQLKLSDPEKEIFERLVDAALESALGGGIVDNLDRSGFDANDAVKTSMIKVNDVIIANNLYGLSEIFDLSVTWNNLDSYHKGVLIRHLVAQSNDSRDLVRSQYANVFLERLIEIDPQIANQISPEAGTPKAASDGDPHLTTFDGLFYDFQAVGEFVLARGEDFEIQVRQEAIGTSASANTAIAMRFDDNVVSVYAKPDGHVVINGEEVEIGLGETVAIGGGSIHRFDFWHSNDPNTTVYEVVDENGNGYWVNIYGGILHVRAFLAEDSAGAVEGLLGNANGTLSDDLALADGTVLGTTVASQMLYGEYADSWRVTQADTLFIYGAGESTETFTDRSFPSDVVTYETLDPAVRAAAEEIVRAAGVEEGTLAFENAVLDVALSGDPAFAAAAAAAPQRDEEPVPVVVQRPPTAVADSASVDEDTAFTIDLVANDTDPEGDALTLHSVFDPVGGHISIVDNALVYTPKADFNGQTTLTYIIGDGHGNFSDGSLALTVNPVNDVPVAADDAYTVLEGATLAIAAGESLLANDRDVEGDALSAVLVSGPAHGTLALNSDGSFTYTPEAGFNGADSFSYKTNDGSVDSTAAAVALIVAAVNNVPVLTVVATASFVENGTGPVLAASATDPDGDALTWSLSGSDADLFAISAGGTLSFKSAPDFEDPADADGDNVYEIVISASDGDLATAQAVAVTVANVNEAPWPAIYAPEPGATATASIDENGLPVVMALGGVDPEDDALTFSLSGTDAALFELIDGVVLAFKSVPDFEAPADADGNGIYDLVITASDGRLSGSRELAVVVTNVDEAPVITAPSAVTLPENSTSIVASAQGRDPDGQSITWSLSGADGSLFDISPEGVLTFKSAPDFEAPQDSNPDNIYDVWLVADDGTRFTVDALTVTVSDVNEAPLLTLPTTVAFAENGTGPVASIGASDPDGDGLTFSLSGADAGLFALADDGTFRFKSAPDYEAPADAGGDNIYDVTFTVSDGALSVTKALAVTVTDVSESTGPVPITGDGGSNSLTGTSGADLILTGAGNDTVRAGDGDDTVSGDEGSDQLFGGAGNDQLSGGAGLDMLWGETGDDVLSGGGGLDQLFGGAGNDKLAGGAGNDMLWGDAGDDTIAGDAGLDQMFGGTGNDRLAGGAGNDMLWGDAGDDTLAGDAGNDLLFGGPGRDTFVFKPGGGRDTVYDFSTLPGSSDRIALDATAFADYQALVQLGALSDSVLGAQITYDDGSSLTLLGVRTASLSADDFRFV